MTPNKTRAQSFRETAAARRTRAQRVAKNLLELYGGAECALTHKNAFELLIATILSAQCTDERVNKVTPKLFATFPTPAAMMGAPEGAIEELVKTTGFYNNKAKNIRGASTMIVKEFGGQVPRDMESLLKLPGVARKTANVVLGTAFGIRSGFVVDTHVMRLSRRFKFTDNDSPEKIEADLCELLPNADWIGLGHSLIWHGRKVCSARTPNCSECPLAELCPSNGLAPDAWKK